MKECNGESNPCVESKLLALHTSIVCLAKTLALSGQLDRSVYRKELAKGRSCSTFPTCPSAQDRPGPWRSTSRWTPNQLH